MLKFQEKQNASVRDVADEFGYSVGQTANCLTLAYALRVYEELEDVKHYTKAIKFIKVKNFRRSFD